MKQTINARIAEFVCGFDERDLSDAARKSAMSAVTDTLAVTCRCAEDSVRRFARTLSRPK